MFGRLCFREQFGLLESNFYVIPEVDCRSQMRIYFEQVIQGCRRFFDLSLETASAIHFLKGSWDVDCLAYFQEKSLSLMVERFENYLGDENIGILQVILSFSRISFLDERRLTMMKFNAERRTL